MKPSAGKKTNLNRMLSSPDKGASRTEGIGGILARLFREVLHDRDVTQQRWSLLSHQYINRTDYRHASGKTRTSVLGNLTKALYNTEMTWKTFCRALQFVQAKRFRITIEAEYSDGSTTLNTAVIEFDDTQLIELDEDEKPSDLDA